MRGAVINISTDIIDVPEVLEWVDGDKELLGELVDLFLEESPSMLPDVKEAVAQNDAKALEYAAHTLKGSVGNFVAEDACEAAFVLEKAGRAGSLTGAETALVALEKALQELEPISSFLSMEMAA